MGFCFNTFSLQRFGVVPKKRSFLLLLLLLQWFSETALTQNVSAIPEPQSKALSPVALQPSVSSIFGKGEFRSPGFSGRWGSDDKSYEVIDALKPQDPRGLVQVDTESGQRQWLVTPAQLTPPGASQPLDIDDYQWSSDRKKLLIFTNSKRVWRYATRGDYWVVDLTSSTLRKLGRDFPESTLMFAKLSPQSQSVAYVHQGNIYSESLESGAIEKLTQGDGRQIISGTFDWVYEEELALRDGFQFSPDGKSIAYWQIDTFGVEMFPLVDNTSSLYPRIQWLAYPKVGTTNPSARIGVLDLQSKQTTWMKLPGDPRQHYLARMQWAPKSGNLLIQQLNRLQNQLSVFLADPTSGEVRRVLSEQDSCWVDIHDELFWDEQGRRITWPSERNGWRQIFWVDVETGAMEVATPHDFDIIELVSVDSSGGHLYFIASPENPSQRYLYRSRFDGRELTRLSPADLPGTHRYQVSPSSMYAFHTYSRSLLPPATSLIRLPDHRTLMPLREPKELQEKLTRLELPSPEFIQISIPSESLAKNAPETTQQTTQDQNQPITAANTSTVQLDAWQILPKDFARREKVPVIIFVYGEPAGQTVLDAWGGDRGIWHAALAKRGFAVFSIDNRGTPAPKGRAWRKSIYGQVGVLASADQANALKALLAKYPQLDANRVAIWGWSGGGSMTLNALFRYPDLYQRGVSIAPVPNQLYYDTIYQERYMGLPSDNAEGYRRGSPISFASQLKGELLLIHGTGDDNCHYQTTELLINELIAQKKIFRMFAYPNRSHSINEGRGTTEHLFQTVTDFLLEGASP